MNVGFIGLGNMGLSLALNLIRGEAKVTGFDLTAKRLSQLDAAGAGVNTTISLRREGKSNAHAL